MKTKTAGSRQRLAFPFDIKNLGNAGSFAGYGSVFGNVDLGDDIVERGAFTKINTTKDGSVRILWQHDTRQPIGKAKVKQDDIGLYTEGQLLLDTSKGREAYALLKSGIVDGMSIGYDVLPDGSSMTSQGKRMLKSLELWEVSLVTFGMNQLATVDSVKAAHGITTKRQFEEFLRDNGFTEAAAKSISAAGYREQAALQRRDVGSDVKELMDTITGASLVQQRDAGTGLKSLRDWVHGFTL
jgi:HK97 family phage prohead protease